MKHRNKILKFGFLILYVSCAYIYECIYVYVCPKFPGFDECAVFGTYIETWSCLESKRGSLFCLKSYYLLVRFRGVYHSDVS